MSYQECEALVCKYLTNVDINLQFYYINYLFVTSNHNLLPKNESIEDLLIKANRYGRHLNFYNSSDKKYEEMGPNVKGFVRVDNNCDTINVRDNLPNEQEKTIYHEIHHIMQIDKNTLNIGISLNYYLKLINEAATEYVAEFVYNTIHGQESIEIIYQTEDIFMHSGGECCASVKSYQYFDNILTKLCLLLGVSKDYFVHLNYDYSSGRKIFIGQISSVIDKYNHQKKEVKYEIKCDDIIDLMNDITATYYHIYYNRPTDIDFYYICDDYNYFYCVSPRDLENMVDSLDSYLFELISDVNLRREFLKYVINPRLKEEFYNEITYNIKSLTMNKFLEIKS